WVSLNRIYWVNIIGIGGSVWQEFPISKASKEECRAFKIMTSPLHKNTLILRWLSLDITDPDRTIQCYRYRCYYPDGNPQNCSIHYSNQEEANHFFSGLKEWHHQHYCIDHKS
ncbi:hypothetical protein, partial [Aquimarina algiphila]